MRILRIDRDGMICIPGSGFTFPASKRTLGIWKKRSLTDGDAWWLELLSKKGVEVIRVSRVDSVCRTSLTAYLFRFAIYSMDWMVRLGNNINKSMTERRIVNEIEDVSTKRREKELRKQIDNGKRSKIQQSMLCSIFQALSLLRHRSTLILISTASASVKVITASTV